MYRQGPRIPKACPEGFKGRYVVSPGDTLYRISQIFRVRLEALYANNHHIPNPNILIPGDVLCVPALIPIPCCVELQKQGRVPFATSALAYAGFGPQGGQSISVVATLPPPSYFGNYDIYITTAFFEDIGGFGNQLFPTPQDPPTWSSRIDLPTVVSISDDTRITIQPSNSITGISGRIILESTFIDCCSCRRKNIDHNLLKVSLEPTSYAPSATGLADIILNPAMATVVGINLPNPESLGSSNNTYRGWIIDTQTQNRFRIDLQRVNSNLWIGQGQGGSLTGFDQLIITAEPSTGASSPTGPTVLEGSLKGC